MRAYLYIPIVLEDAGLLAALGNCSCVALPPASMQSSATAPRLWLPASPYLLYPYSRALLYLLHPCSRRQLLLGSGFLLRPISYIHIVVRCSTSCIHAVVTHPNHLLLVGSWGFAQLPPTCISNSNGYKYPCHGFRVSNFLHWSTGVVFLFHS